MVKKNKIKDLSKQVQQQKQITDEIAVMIHQFLCRMRWNKNNKTRPLIVGIDQCPCMKKWKRKVISNLLKIINKDKKIKNNTHQMWEYQKHQAHQTQEHQIMAQNQHQAHQTQEHQFMAQNQHQRSEE